MDIQAFLSIGIIGVATSILIEAIQKQFGTGSTKTKAIAIIASIIIGSFYFFLSNTVWWADVVGVLSGASTIYALIFNGSKPTPQPEG